MGELLFRDSLWLFRAGDTDGGLMSLERMLVLGPMTDRLRHFLGANEPKLMSLFETVIGPWANIPRKTNRDDIPAFFRADPKCRAILQMVNDERNLQEIVDESPYVPLETCSVLHQLVRAQVIEIAEILEFET